MSLETFLRDVLTAAAPLTADEKVAMARAFQADLKWPDDLDVGLAIRMGRDDEDGYRAWLEAEKAKKAPGGVIVVDTNGRVVLSVRHSFSEQAIGLLQKARPVVAPDLIIPEFVNSLLNMLRLKTVDADRARDAVEFAPRWFEELVPARVLHRCAYDLSRELSHSVYDCFYVALAEERGCA